MTTKSNFNILSTRQFHSYSSEARKEKYNFFFNNTVIILESNMSRSIDYIHISSVDYFLSTY